MRVKPIYDKPSGYTLEVSPVELTALKVALSTISTGTCLEADISPHTIQLLYGEICKNVPST